MRTRYRLGRLVFGLTLAMTDVAGPPAPPPRFSSVPIRGTDAATAGGAGESNLETSCSMAQVFNIPTGNRIAARWTHSPDRRSRPARPHPLDRWLQYGFDAGWPQARKYWPNTSCGGPDSGFGDPAEVNQFRCI